jgi:hypothetical protein
MTWVRLERARRQAVEKRGAPLGNVPSPTSGRMTWVRLERARRQAVEKRGAPLGDIPSPTSRERVRVREQPRRPDGGCSPQAAWTDFGEALHLVEDRAL